MKYICNLTAGLLM